MDSFAILIFTGINSPISYAVILNTKKVNWIWVDYLGLDLKAIVQQLKQFCADHRFGKFQDQRNARIDRV